MIKQSIYISLIVSVLVFSGMASQCFAETATQLEQAKELKENGFFNQAENIYNTIITNNPSTNYALKAQKGLILMYIHLEKFSNAQKSFDKLSTEFSGNPDLPGTLYEVAKRYEKARRYQKAKGIYQDIMQRYPGSSCANRAQLAIPTTNILFSIDTGQIQAAQAAVAELITGFSGNQNLAEALHDIAFRYRKFKRYQEAAELYQYVVNTWPTAEYAMWAQMGVAKTNAEAGNYTAAQIALNKLLTNYSNHSGLPTALHYIARRYRKAKKYEEAKSIYQQIIQKYPGSSYASNAQIEIAKLNILPLIHSGQDTAAQTAINSLVAGFSGNLALPATLYAFGWEYEYLGKHEKAKNLFQQIIEQHPDNVRAEKARMDISRAEIFVSVEAGEHNKALADVDKLITDFQWSVYLPDVVYQIGNRYRKKASQAEDQGHADQARDLLQKAVTIYEKLINQLPGSSVTPKACCNAGEEYRRLGDYEKSNRYYQKVVDDYPEFNMGWNALFLVGHNYQDLGKSGLISRSEAYSKTKAAYQQLLEKYPTCSAVKAARRWLIQYNRK